MTNLGTETIEDILGDTFTPEQKAIFPIKQKLAFYHPMRPDILIFLGGEMPHLVKKPVNALENSGTKPTRDLILGGKRLSLLMLQKVWVGNSLSWYASSSPLSAATLLPKHVNFQRGDIA